MNRSSLLARRPIITRLAAVAAAAALAFVPSVTLAADPIVMKIGTASLNDVQHEFMKRYAAALNKDSKGRIKVEIYPASQLGSIPREIEATQFGSIQAWVGPPEFLSGVDPRYEVLSAPFVLGDMRHAGRVLEDKEFRSAFFALGANKGLKGLALFIHGPIEFDLRKPVKPADGLKNLKVRVLAAPLQMEQVTRLGGTPVPMALDQVLPALQQGAIDGVMSDLAIFSSLRYADAAKYVLESDQAMLTSCAVVSKQWFDGLPADLQALVLADGEKVGSGMLSWAIDYTNAQKAVWRKAGGSFISLSPAEHAALNAKMSSVASDVLKDKPEVKKLYDLMAEASKRVK